jgi:hypothetical protein
MKNRDLMNADVNDWPIPNEYLTELGRVSALWSCLESALMLASAKLAGFNDLHNPAGYIVFAHSSFPQRLDILGALCEQLQSQYENLKGYESVLSSLKAAQKSRNRLIHNGLTINADTGKVEIAVGSARGKVKTLIEVVELADIRRAAADVHNAMRALTNLVFQTSAPSKFGEA